MDNVAEYILLIDFTRGVPSRISGHGKCLYYAATMHFVGNTSLAYEFTTFSQLKHNIIVSSIFTGPKSRRVELDVVNSVTVGTFRGCRRTAQNEVFH